MTPAPMVAFSAAATTALNGELGRQKPSAHGPRKGTTAHPSGSEWSVHGTIDRITGSLGATVTQSEVQQPPDQDELRADL
jgi:hypothetical protein